MKALPTALYLVHGADPVARAEQVETLLQRFSNAKRTLMGSSELFSVIGVEQQAQVFELDKARKAQGIHVLRLSPGCLCCSSKLVLSTHLARTLRLNQPEVLVLELESQSHPEQVRELLSDAQWSNWFSSVQVMEAKK